MRDVTRILSAVEQGDPHAAEQLLPLVYDELRRLAAAKLAQEKPGQTLDEAARALGVSPTTADRYWAYARAWLHQELTGGGAAPPP